MDSAQFPYTQDIPVRFRDLDVLGHVNHAVYLTYMEAARTDFLIELLALDGPGQLPVILGEVTCRYLAPVYSGETVRVGLGVSRWGNKSFDLLYRLETMAGRAVATGRTTLIMYDYEKGETIGIPAALRERVEQFQSGWQPPPDGQRTK
ncbi:MAG: thioesterase family protein [Candidatus Promineifilaceae bacterium]|nr:thioesterase family protein [Candidatus Promineifilaceae bacterium]